MHLTYLEVSKGLSTVEIHGGVLRSNNMLELVLKKSIIWTRFLTWGSPHLAIPTRVNIKAELRSASNFSKMSVRFVHDTKKKDSTTLVTSEKSSMAFHKMSLNTLKNECRSRGLKVSGRKAELVSRITSNQGLNELRLLKHTVPSCDPKKMTINTPKRASGKLDQTTSTVMPERIKKPETITISSLKQDCYKNIQKAPEPRFAESNTVTNKTTIGTNQAVISEYVISARDKRFFFGFATFVCIWWTSQYIGDRER